MLPRYYRFKVLNGTGQTIAADAIKVFARRWKIVAGVLTLESTEATVFNNGTTLATDTYAAGASLDNGTDKYFGGSFMFEVTAPASASGDVTLFLERSTDNTNYDDDGGGVILKILNFTATGTKRRSFSL